MLLGVGGCRWVTADHLEPYSLSVAGLYPWNDPVPPPRYRNVKNPTFYGYQSTCWQAWPQPWPQCPPPVGEGNAEEVIEAIPPGVPQYHPGEPAETTPRGRLLDGLPDMLQDITPEENGPAIAEPPVANAEEAEGAEPPSLEAIHFPPTEEITFPPSIDVPSDSNGHSIMRSLPETDVPVFEASPSHEKQPPTENGSPEPPQAIESKTPPDDAKPLRQPMILNETGAKSIVARYGRLSSTTQTTTIDASGGTIQVVGYVAPEPKSEPPRAKKSAATRPDRDSGNAERPVLFKVRKYLGQWTDGPSSGSSM